jgi:hypothetical protein
LIAMADVAALIREATGLDLFQPHGAFEVHCVHCHARLDGNGDCAMCGLIGRPPLELERRAAADPDRVAKLLGGAIAKRRAYDPAAKG